MKAKKVAEFVVACSNAAELLELIEEAFDVVDLARLTGAPGAAACGRLAMSWKRAFRAASICPKKKFQ